MSKPSKLDEWIKGDNLILLQGWARSGLTNTQIASNIGITRDTLWDWSKKNSVIRDTLKRNKEVADFEVENALYKNAMSGNVTAQIFWLKNRMPKAWREKVELEQSADTLNKIDELLSNIKKRADTDGI